MTDFDFTRYKSVIYTTEEWTDASRANLINFISTEARNFNSDDQVICIRLALNDTALFKYTIIYVYRNMRARRCNEEDLKKLKDCISTWSGWDAIASLIHHKDIIDRLRLFLGRNNDTQARKLGALDVDALCINLRTIIQNRNGYRVLSNLKGEDAQKILDLVQTLVDSSFLDSQFKTPFMSALLRLSKKSCFFPRTLVQNPVVFDRDYSIYEGSYGKVYTGTYHGGVVAVKLLQGYLNTGPEKRRKTIVNEALIWRQLRHPNILPFLFLCYYGDETRTQVGLVSPWMENGNVQEYLRQVPSADRTSLVLDVVRGLAYLHSMEPIIIHGDLKAINILITKAGIACLADFGLSRVLDTQIVKFTSWTVGQPGTLRWTAPEVLNQDDDHEVPANTATDMYAVGGVIYEIYSGQIPFANIRGNGGVFSRIVSGRRPPRPVLSEPTKKTCKSLGLSDGVWRVVKKCWKANPKQRPTAEEAIQRLQRMAITPKRRTTGMAVRGFTSALNADENFISWAAAYVQTSVNVDHVLN